MAKRKAALFVCGVENCNKGCVTRGGLKQHMRTHKTCPVAPNPRSSAVVDDMDIDRPDNGSLNGAERVPSPLQEAHTVFHAIIDGTISIFHKKTRRN